MTDASGLLDAQPSPEYYFEYIILKDRPGLLGDIASLLGMLGFNILQLNGFAENRRGFLLKSERESNVAALKTIIAVMDDVELTALRAPYLRDKIALRHGRFIERSNEETKTYRFVRDELGVLVDFLGELLKRPGRQVIGVRGQPRVGKTESIVAASVYANKRWVVVSSTLLKETVLRDLPKQMTGSNIVYMMDGAVSMARGDESHQRVVDEVLRMPVPIIIEHPDLFVRNRREGWSMFDCILELRRDPDEEIVTDWSTAEDSMWQD